MTRGPPEAACPKLGSGVITAEMLAAELSAAAPKAAPRRRQGLEALQEPPQVQEEPGELVVVQEERQLRAHDARLRRSAQTAAL